MPFSYCNAGYLLQCLSTYDTRGDLPPEKSSSGNVTSPFTMARSGPERRSRARKSRFNEEQIIAILKESEAGTAPDELCRRHGITRGSLYRWKAKYGGMEVSEARRLRQLEEENRQLKHAVAELLLDKRALQAVVTKKW